MKRLLVVLIVIMQGNIVLGQATAADFSKMTDFMPPPPNASSIIKNGMVAVNKNTGAPNINIPLYSIKGHKLSTGLSLNYNCTGIKVDEVAGRVGMGWSLNAGGVITRTQRGLPDEGKTRAEMYGTTFGPNCGNWEFLQKADGTLSGYDAEPDLFNFNMNGISGSFVFNNAMTAVPANPERYKILTDFSSGATWNFKIITTDGTRYYFGGSVATEKSKRNQTCGKTYNSFVANAWYLTKIEHPNGETIDFGYSDHTYNHDNGTTETLTWSQLCGSPGYVYPCGNITQTQGVLLTSISNDFTSISISYASRSDVNDKLVNEIKIIDKAEPLVTNGKFIFGYTSYTGNNSFNHLTYTGYSINTNITPYLTSLTEQSTDAQYTRSHSFTYNSPGSRPPRLSYAQDHWGYFNGQYNTTLIPEPADPLMQTRFPGATANREISEANAQKGMLTKVTYPTGGWEGLEYETNKYYNVGTSTHTNIGGVRVKRITAQNPGETYAAVKKYYYGEISTIEQSSLINSYLPQYIKIYKAEATNGYTGECDHIGMYSNSLQSLISYQSSPVSYRYVVEGYGENFEGGALQSKFAVGADAAGVIVQGLEMQGAPKSNFSNAFNGKLEEETVFKKGVSTLFPVKKTANTYYLDTRMSDRVDGHTVYRKFPIVSWPSCNVANPADDNNFAAVVDNYDVMRYEFHSYWVYLQSSVETQYDENGLNPVTQSTSYTYSDIDHLQVTKTETTDGQGRLLTTHLKYPKDYLPATVYADMITENIISPVINFKQTKTVGLTPLMEVETSYTEPTSNNFVPSEIKKSMQGGTLISEGTFDAYDAKGNLLQYTDKSGIVNAVVWGYGHLYPVAKITGSTYANAVAYLTGGSVASLQTMDGEALRTELNKIRTGLSTAFVTTYTYKRLAGVSSITDANNKIASYEYDSFNRLALIRDQEGNVLKKYCYNYAGQAEDCTIPIPCPPGSSQPAWQNTGNVRCQVNLSNCSYTGYQETEQRNTNFCSIVAGSPLTQWIQGDDPNACSGSGLVQLAVINNTGASNLIITFTQTAPSSGTPQSYSIPASSGPIACLLSGKSNKYNVSITANGAQLLASFTLGGITITGTPANFSNMSFILPLGGGPVNLVIDPDF